MNRKMMAAAFFDGYMDKTAARGDILKAVLEVGKPGLTKRIAEHLAEAQKLEASSYALEEASPAVKSWKLPGVKAQREATSMQYPLVKSTGDVQEGLSRFRQIAEAGGKQDTDEIMKTLIQNRINLRGDPSSFPAWNRETWGPDHIQRQLAHYKEDKIWNPKTQHMERRYTDDEALAKSVDSVAFMNRSRPKVLGTVKPEYGHQNLIDSTVGAYGQSFVSLLNSIRNRMRATKSLTEAWAPVVRDTLQGAGI